MTRSERELRNSSMSKLLTPRLADFPMTTVEKLRFADTDRLGHITNTVFAVCCQNARMELLCDPRRVPIPRNTRSSSRGSCWSSGRRCIGPARSRSAHASSGSGDPRPRLAQVLFVHEACVATAESVAAMMDMTTRRSALLPGETAEALRAMGWANSGGVPAATAVNVLHR
jgi:acyl-CoA thioester hydrolase